jgi:hypothetical protein
MCAGDPCRNHGQGAIALTLVLEPVLEALARQLVATASPEMRYWNIA